MKRKNNDQFSIEKSQKWAMTKILKLPQTTVVTIVSKIYNKGQKDAKKEVVEIVRKIHQNKSNIFVEKSMMMFLELNELTLIY